MFTKRNQSAWTFSTSSSVSGGGPVYGPLGYTTSQVTLVFTAPDGAIVEFEYWSAGPSVGLPKSFPSSLTGSTRGDFSTGVIYVSSSFSGSELSIEDFKGFTLIEEASVGVWDGHSGTIMFLGVPLIHMPMEIVNNTGALGIGAQLAVDHPTIARVLASIANPLGGLAFDMARGKLSQLVQDNAKAALFMRGDTTGLQVQAGISQSIGYVWGGNVTQRAPVPPPGPWKLTVTPILPDQEVLHLPGDVLFAFDKADLKTRANVKPHAEDVLWAAAYYIQKKSPSRIRIEGHTDGIGPAKYNMGLSVRRAEAVRQWLIARKIVTPSNTEIMGWGMSKPAVPNRKSNRDDPVGRAKNRRVEIWLTT
jgi:outer membrane protein OmpA-like peptidoglycan-associated protein